LGVEDTHFSIPWEARIWGTVMKRRPGKEVKIGARHPIVSGPKSGTKFDGQRREANQTRKINMSHIGLLCRGGKSVVSHCGGSKTTFPRCREAITNLGVNERFQKKGNKKKKLVSLTGEEGEKGEKRQKGNGENKQGTVHASSQKSKTNKKEGGGEI